MERDCQIVADLITIDNGKIIKDATGEAFGASKLILYYAELCQQISGRTLNMGMNITKFYIVMCSLFVFWYLGSYALYYFQRVDFHNTYESVFTVV